MAEENSKFSFNISLSVLNHLGRNLYRSFITVLGEAISNAWDADAKNVWIYINRDKNFLLVKDDGAGMSDNDFQNKFLKVGYSKREHEQSRSPGNRPYIGRKGIGKLALLSCAQKIRIISKVEGESDYVGGTINNTILNKKITEDSTEYPLEKVELDVFKGYLADHNKGTLIHFDQIDQGIKNRIEYLKAIIALYFRFSLVDSTFNIYLNGEKVTEKNLSSLAENTEFLWTINTLDDPFIQVSLDQLKESELLISEDINFKGFIASVNKPSHLKVFSSDEKIGLDLFVNGRLREKNILKHMPAFSTRHVASYLYGQIHFDGLDDDTDRFTSSRESIVSGDTKYDSLLSVFKSDILPTVSNQWDDWRIKHKEDGDPENTTKITKKERKAKELVNETFNEYTPEKASPNKDLVNEWLAQLNEDAQFNLSSYADCFVSENLIRKYIKHKKLPLSPEAIIEVKKWKGVESDAKNRANISFQITRKSDDHNYLSMDDLANFVDKLDSQKYASLSRDAKEYKPMRNAVAHTALISDVAKIRLNIVYENIKARLRELLS